MHPETCFLRASTHSSLKFALKERADARFFRSSYFSLLLPPLTTSLAPTRPPLLQPKQHLAFHLTFFATAFAFIVLFVVTITLRTRWSVASFSAFASFIVVLTSTLQARVCVEGGREINDFWGGWVARGRAFIGFLGVWVFVGVV